MEWGSTILKREFEWCIEISAKKWFLSVASAILCMSFICHLNWIENAQKVFPVGTVCDMCTTYVVEWPEYSSRVEL